MYSDVNKGYSFGEFELDADRRRLSKDGEQVNINPKAFDLLLTLVENHGQTLTKNDLLERVWENQFVEENNLTVHVAALRRALGETKGKNRYIVTVPGTGYRFVGEIEPFQASEIVIESRQFDRIVVEEDTGNGAQPARLNGNGRAHTSEALATAVKTRPRTSRNAIFIAVIPVILLVGGIWFFNPAGSSTSAPGRKGETIVRPFATSGGIPHRVAISPDGKTLAYVQRTKGEDSLWIGDIAANQNIQITQPSERLHDYLEFSPDGRSIYFTARDDNHLVWTLMRVSIFGGAVQDLIAGVHGGATFSPDGKSVAFYRLISETGPRAFSLIIADAETGANERVIVGPDASPRLVNLGLSWSPDGHIIAFSRANGPNDGCDIALYHVSDGSFETFGESQCSGSTFTWLRDGRGFVLAAPEKAESKKTQIWQVSYPAGEKEKVTADALHYGRYSLSVSADDRIAVLETRNLPNIVISPAGQASASRQVLQGSLRSEGGHGLTATPDNKIIYTVTSGGSRTIWEMNFDGTDQRQLTPLQNGSQDVQPHVTPDNRFIIFESQRSGSPEIWRANRDGSDLRQLTVGGSNSEPTLTPDGRSVFYTSKQNGVSTIRRIPVDGGPPEQITSEDTSWPAISPDGKFIACLSGNTTDATRQKIAVYPISGGKPVKSFTAAKHAALYNRVRWAPDGRAIVYKDTVQGLWRQDLDRDTPDRLAGFDDIRVFHFAYSPAGEMIYSGGVQMRQIVLIENFR